MAQEIKVEVINNQDLGRFEAHLGDAVAFTEYRLQPDGILFPHTEVPAAFEGRGVGGALVRAGMAFAREKGLLVKPECPFVAGYLRRHHEYDDLVHPAYKARLGIG